jgi:hypothetical protein
LPSNRTGCIDLVGAKSVGLVLAKMPGRAAGVEKLAPAATSAGYQDHDRVERACCTLENPRGGDPAQSHDPQSSVPIPRRVIKGGSFLCAPNYCQRYRPGSPHGASHRHVNLSRWVSLHLAVKGTV